MIKFLCKKMNKTIFEVPVFQYFVFFNNFYFDPITSHFFRSLFTIIKQAFTVPFMAVTRQNCQVMQFSSIIFVNRYRHISNKFLLLI